MYSPLLMYRVFHILDKFTPRYFTLFDAVVNGIYIYIYIYISHSDSLLVVYGNVTDFYLLILHPATFLTTF